MSRHAPVRQLGVDPLKTVTGQTLHRDQASRPWIVEARHHADPPVRGKVFV